MALSHDQLDELRAHSEEHRSNTQMDSDLARERRSRRLKFLFATTLILTAVFILAATSEKLHSMLPHAANLG